MKDFLPNNLNTFWLIGAGSLCSLVLSFAVSRIRSPVVGRSAAWLLLVVSIGLTVWLTAPEPPIVQIYIFQAVLIAPLKAIMSVETQAAGEPMLRPLTWFAFGAAGATMRPTIYATLGDPPLPGAFRMMVYGVTHVALGVLLCWLARWAWILSTNHFSEVLAPYLAIMLLLPGIGLVLLWGIPSIAGGGWRLLGVDWRSLFRSPFQSQSLTEFWGRRWNLAFIEVTTIAVYRPLRGILGGGLATVAAFGWSAVVHELLITVPLKRYYGIPTLYFAAQCLGVFIERGLERIGRPIARTGWLGRVWTIAWFAAPFALIAPELIAASRMYCE